MASKTPESQRNPMVSESSPCETNRLVPSAAAPSSRNQSVLSNSVRKTGWHDREDGLDQVEQRQQGAENRQQRMRSISALSGGFGGPSGSALSKAKGSADVATQVGTGERLRPSGSTNPGLKPPSCPSHELVRLQCPA